MTQAELQAMLKTLGLPVAYHHFKAFVSPPYIVFLASGGAGWGADDKNFVKRVNYQVELYSKEKDQENQDKLEALFDERGIEYGVSEEFIESEKLYQAVYTIEFTMKIRRAQ